jgi:hypothetical protein
MTYLRRYRINATVTATGGASQAFYTPVVNGFLHAIYYKHGTTGTTASGVSTDAHLTVQTAESSNVMLSCTATGIRAFYPRLNIESAAGATIAGFERFPVADERIKVEFSSAGTASAGGRRATVDLYIDGVIGG